MQVWFARAVPRYFNCSTLSKGLLPTFMFWFSWYQGVTMYLVTSVFSSRPTSLPTTIKICVFLHGLHASTQHINVIRIDQNLMCTISNIKNAYGKISLLEISLQISSFFPRACKLYISILYTTYIKSKVLKLESVEHQTSKNRNGNKRYKN